MVAAPLGQTVGSPAWHEVMSQFCVPAVSGGHVTTQSPSQIEWHGPDWQLNAQLLPAPHAHVPLAQVPSHEGLSPSQVTWQGGASQSKSQSLPTPHVHEPFAHAPEQLEPSSQST